MPAISIDSRREMIDVSTMGHHVPDPKWSAIDAHGHVHRFEGNVLPSLEWVVTATYWCDTCRDEHEEGEWRCRICAGVVEPHYDFTGPQHLQVPGLAEITLSIDGREYPITPDEAESLRGLDGDALVQAAAKIAAMREP